MPSNEADNALVLWRVNLPQLWPPPPSQMSYSSLRDIEACPLRWGLTHASYPELWRGRGYPPQVSLSRLTGQVLHRASEFVVRAVGATGAPERSYTPALRRLGGLSATLERAIEAVLLESRANPRVASRLPELQTVLRREMGTLRSRLQSLLGRLPNEVQRTPPGTGNRSQLGFRRDGLYSEVPVACERLGWKGVIDLLVIDNGSCTIVDFKSGVPSPEHETQVKLYALLWQQDRQANPDNLPVNRLAIRYETVEQEVALPNGEALSDLEDSLVARGTAARAAATRNPPECRIDSDVCPRCDVRHLCSGYWEARRNQMIPPTAQALEDCQVLLEAPRADGQVLGRVEVGTALSVGASVMIKARMGDRRRDSFLQQVGRIRVLGARIAVEASDTGAGRTILHINGGTEIFVVDRLPGESIRAPLL